MCNIKVKEIDCAVSSTMMSLHYGAAIDVLIERNIAQFGDRIGRWIVKCAGIILEKREK